jgi:hypothetical protein
VQTEIKRGRHINRQGAPHRHTKTLMAPSSRVRGRRWVTHTHARTHAHTGTRTHLGHAKPQRTGTARLCLCYHVHWRRHRRKPRRRHRRKPRRRHRHRHRCRGRCSIVEHTEPAGPCFFSKRFDPSLVLAALRGRHAHTGLRSSPCSCCCCQRCLVDGRSGCGCDGERGKRSSSSSKRRYGGRHEQGRWLGAAPRRACAVTQS